MTEVNNPNSDTKNRKDIRKRLVKIVDLTEKIDKFISFVQKSGTNVETGDDVMVEVKNTLADIERESLLSYCNEQVLFLMKNLMAESMKIDVCRDECVKQAFGEVTKGYDEVKQAFDSFELMNRQQISANGKEDLQKCYDQGKNIVEKLQMLTTSTENYFDVEDRSDSNRLPSDQLAVSQEALLRKEIETIRMRETIKDIREKLVVKFKRQKRVAKKREERRLAELNEEQLSLKKQISKLEATCVDQQAVIYKFEQNAGLQEQQVAELREQTSQQLGQIKELTATLDEERTMAANKEECNNKDFKILVSNLEKEKKFLNKSLKNAEEAHLRLQMDLSRKQKEIIDIREQNRTLVASKKDYNEMLEQNKNLREEIAKSQANLKGKTLEFLHREEELKKQLNMTEEKYRIECAKLESERASQEQVHCNVDVQPREIEVENAALKRRICEMQKLKKNQLGLTFGLERKVNLLRRRMRNKMTKHRQQTITRNIKITKMKQELSKEKKSFAELTLKMEKMRTECENQANNMTKKVEKRFERIYHEQIELHMEIKVVEGNISKAFAKLDEEKKIWLDATVENVKSNSRELNRQIVRLEMENKNKDTQNCELMNIEERLKTRLQRMHAENEKLQSEYGMQLATNHQLKMTLKSLQSQPTSSLTEKEIRTVIGEMDRKTFADLEATSRLQEVQSERMLKMLSDVEDRLTHAKSCIDHVAPNVDMINEDWMNQLIDIIQIMRVVGRKCNNCGTQDSEKKFDELETKLDELRQRAKETTEKHKVFFEEWANCYEKLCAQSDQYRHDLSEMRDMIERMCNKYKAMQLSTFGQRQSETVQDPSDITRRVASLGDDKMTVADKRSTLLDIVETVRADLHEPCPSTTLTTVNSTVSFMARPTAGNNALGKTFGDYRRELLKWCRERTASYGLKINDFGNSWTSGLAFCALIHSYRPDLFNYKDLNVNDTAANFKKAESLSAQLGLTSDFNAVANCLKLKRPKYLNVMKFIEKLILCLESQK